MSGLVKKLSFLIKILRLKVKNSIDVLGICYQHLNIYMSSA